jgi:hypothetical protein
MAAQCQPQRESAAVAVTLNVLQTKFHAWRWPVRKKPAVYSNISNKEKRKQPTTTCRPINWTCVIWLQITDPSSRQRGRPTSRNPQLSKNNQREKGKNCSRVPDGCLTPRRSWSTDCRSLHNFDFDLLALHSVDEGISCSCPINNFWHHRVLLFGTTMNQKNPVHILTIHLFNIHFSNTLQ